MKDFIAVPVLNRKRKSQKLLREDVNEVGWFRLQCFVWLMFYVVMIKEYAFTFADCLKYECEKPDNCAFCGVGSVIKLF